MNLSSIILPKSMQPFRDSTALLKQPTALKQRFDEDGYVFIKATLPKPALLSLRNDILSICAAENWLKPGTDAAEGYCWTTPKVEGEEDYFAVYDEVQKLESLHSLAHHSALLDIMNALLGGSSFPHPKSITRLVFPDNHDWSTPPHQDYPNNQGTERLYACWIPLGDYRVDEGGLSILSGSHKLGLLPLQYALGAGHRQAILDERCESLKWHSSDFELGDILIFHSLTLHRSHHNNSEKMRLSVDYRYQREGDNLTEEMLFPHFPERLSWEEIYSNWKSDTFKYYWLNKNYNVVPWDNTLHSLPDDHLSDAIKLKRDYDKKRQALAVKFT